RSGGEYGRPVRLVSYRLEASPSRRPPLPAGRDALAFGQVALQLEHRGRSEPHHGPEAPGLTRSRFRRHTIRTRVQILGARWYRLVSVRSTRRAVCLFLARLLVRDPDSWAWACLRPAMRAAGMSRSPIRWWARARLTWSSRPALSPMWSWHGRSRV